MAIDPLFPHESASIRIMDYSEFAVRKEVASENMASLGQCSHRNP